MFSAAGFAKTWQYIDLFKQGLVCTVALSALTVVIGFFLGLLLAGMRIADLRPFRALGIDKNGRQRESGALLALSGFNPLKALATASVELVRETPMLVQLFIV